jgi:hypothetical protein
MNKFFIIFFVLLIIAFLFFALSFDDNYFPLLYIIVLILLTAIPAVVLIRNDSSLMVTVLIFPTLMLSLNTFLLRLGFFSLPGYIDGSILNQASEYYVRKAAIVAMLGNFCLWLGFFFPISKSLGESLGARISNLTSGSVRPSYFAIWLLFITGIIARLFSLKSGISGFFSDEDLRMSSLAWLQILNLLMSLSTLSLLSNFCIQLYKGKNARWVGVLFMLAVELFFQALTGFKAPIFYTFLYLIIATALVKKEFNFKLFLLGIALLVIIIPVNLAVRELFGKGEVKAGDIASIQKGFIDSGKQIYAQEKEKQPFSFALERVVNQSANLEVFSRIMQYVDTHDIRFYGEDFIYLFTWFVPRAIWSSKPKIHRGGWISREVYGGEETTSIGQTLPGDLYINFGIIGVIIGFIFIGALQRIISFGILSVRSTKYVPTAVFVLFWLGNLATIGTGFAGIITNAVFSIIAVSLMFRKDKENEGMNIED